MSIRAGAVLRHACRLTDDGLSRLVCFQSAANFRATQRRSVSSPSAKRHSPMPSKRNMYDYAVHHQHMDMAPSTPPPPPPLSPLSASSPKSLALHDFFADKTTKPKPSYLLRHGASGFAKRRHDPACTSSSELLASTQVGEDAYFCRGDALGVADGVGGWTGTSGANSAMYSRKLMHHAYLQLDRFDDIEDPSFFDYDNADPLDILQRSYDQCTMESLSENVIGASTVCLAILRGDELRIANIGDCGISVIRHNHYVFRSEEQQHAFNFPYQLGTHSRDRPKDAHMFQLKVEKGDIIVMASDGLFDNLYDQQILAVVNAHVQAYACYGAQPHRLVSFDPQHLADDLAKQAKAVSEDRRHADNPFQRRAIIEGVYHQGGKVDDISVLVAVVGDSEDSPDRRL